MSLPSSPLPAANGNNSISALQKDISDGIDKLTGQVGGAVASTKAMQAAVTDSPQSIASTIQQANSAMSSAMSTPAVGASTPSRTTGASPGWGGSDVASPPSIAAKLQAEAQSLTPVVTPATTGVKAPNGAPSVSLSISGIKGEVLPSNATITPGGPAVLSSKPTVLASATQPSVSSPSTLAASGASEVQPSVIIPASQPSTILPAVSDAKPSVSKPSKITDTKPTEIQPLATATSIPTQAVMKEAIKEIGETGKETASALSGLMKSLKEKKPINITLDQVVQGLFFTFLGFQLLLIKLLRPSPWWLLIFTLYGLLFGLGYSFMFYYNKKRKAEACEVLGMNLGLKGLQHLLGALPSWLSYTEREKVAWLNSTLEEVWPFYDKGVCKMVKQQVEGIFEQTLKTMKVPGIKKVGFKQLTFGDAPFRVESIHVNEHQKDAMVMEVDVRWCGEANITLAIELSAGAKMCPRITDISFVGSLRITLKPLVDVIPGFAAAMVTFRKPPRLKYNLDFGKALGGKYAASGIKPFINYVIRNVMVSMLVWPQRLVIPIINTEDMQVEIAKLQYRNQGMVKITVEEANSLKKTDMIGSSDPFVELCTDENHVVATKVQKDTLTPKWGETFWLLVQEPHSQEMRVTVYDKDFFSAKELLSLNVGNAIGSKELLGRVSVRLSQITKQEPEPLTKWYHLGEGDWSAAEGCGKGAGRIKLTCLYRSLETFRSDELAVAERGVLMVRIQQAEKLPRGVGANKRMSVYVRVKCGDQVSITPTVTSDGNHQFASRNTFEFYDIKFNANVKLKVIEKTAAVDDEIGDVDLGVSEVASAHDVNPLTGKKEHGLLLRAFPLENTSGALVAVLRFAPYF